MIIGREGARATRPARSARWLLAALLLSTGCWSAAGPCAADGAGPHGLVLEVTVNTRPGLGALDPGIRTGAAVVKSYRLVNHGGADLHDVWVRDPGMPGAAIRCPGGRGRVPMLTGLHSLRCTATGVARPGAWIGEVRAVGQLHLVRASVQASARSGYAGVGAALALTETARVTGPDRAQIRYVLVNNGNRPVHGVRVTDPALAPARIVCAGGRPVVAHLAAGARAACTAEVRRAPGTYVSRGRADGSDLLRTLNPRGAPVPPPLLTARASARFTLRAPAPVVPVARRPVRPVAQVQRPRVERPAAAPPLAALLFPPTPPPPGIAAPGIAARGTAVPGIGVPGVLPPAPAVPEGVAPGVAPPEPAVPPAPAKGRSPASPPAAALTPAEAPETAVPPAAVPKEARSQPTLLRRLIREDHTPTSLGILAALFLILLPAAIAAAVFGSRRL
ncbi:hypothetical protein [Streptomyces sp. NPDC050264]|uniref:hypothetical protein n=1 Tax=Streptomyces sp. NPDC050264 TaxID=3155038 RepID=UPI00343F88F6